MTFTENRYEISGGNYKQLVKDIKANGGYLDNKFFDEKLEDYLRDDFATHMEKIGKNELSFHCWSNSGGDPLINIGTYITRKYGCMVIHYYCNNFDDVRIGEYGEIEYEEGGEATLLYHEYGEIDEFFCEMFQLEEEVE